MIFPICLLAQTLFLSVVNRIEFIAKELPNVIPVRENHSDYLLPVLNEDDAIILRKSGSTDAGGDDGNDDDGTDFPGPNWWPSTLGEDELFLRKVTELIDYVPADKLVFSWKELHRQQAESFSVSFKKALQFVLRFFLVSFGIRTSIFKVRKTVN